jgi:hypothetical protein
MRSLAIVVAGLFLAPLALLAQEGGEEKKEDEKPPPEFVLESTYETRMKASPRNRAPERESLILPHPNAINIFPEPVVLDAGQAVPYRSNCDLVVWQLAPMTDKRAEYLRERPKLLAEPSKLAVITWCEKNKLALCAEFELRRLLASDWSKNRQGYRSAQKRWLKHADKRSSPYVFPLPVKTACTAFPDKTGHHRNKHGAAYAFDLVIMKGRKMHGGSGRSNGDYYIWGAEIVAQADGFVVLVEDRHADGGAGTVGRPDRANHILVEYGGGIAGFYGHIQKGSAKVKKGQRVDGGDTLALAGNSGASGVPHVHFTLVDRGGFSLKGRFRYETRRGGRWKLVDGEDLKEGATVRNPPGTFE